MNRFQCFTIDSIIQNVATKYDRNKINKIIVKHKSRIIIDIKIIPTHYKHFFYKCNTENNVPLIVAHDLYTLKTYF